MISLGILNQNPAEMGFEGSGIVQAVGSGVKRLSVGDRVLYMGSGCFSTYLTMQETLCIKIDDTMSFEQAAVLPGVYATALMALVDKGNLQQGQVSRTRCSSWGWFSIADQYQNPQSILIHSACGGVGLAAIQIAQMIHADVSPP